MKRQQSGFTLVEIAIVLVIIGLLLGGILKGQEMITQAKIKNVVSDFNGISAAQYAYQDRYKQIPGDDNGASARWTAAASGCSGSLCNGNGIVEGTYNNAFASPAESNLYWGHLRLSGFVGGSGFQQPQNAANGMIGVETGNGAATPAAVLAPAGGGGFTGLIICSANLPDKIAIAVDTQLDDGTAMTGTVRAFLAAAQNEAIPATNAAVYAETGTNTYTMCKAL